MINIGLIQLHVNLSVVSCEGLSFDNTSIAPKSTQRGKIWCQEGEGVVRRKVEVQVVDTNGAPICAFKLPSTQRGRVVHQGTKVLQRRGRSSKASLAKRTTCAVRGVELPEASSKEEGNKYELARHATF